MVFYQGADNHLSFVSKDEDFVKTYFLKDISNTVRITPANQLQVNYGQPPTYRTREEFINFLVEKKKQSFERRLKKAQDSLLDLEKGIVLGAITLDDLILANQIQEASIEKL